jgi:hypothetical protein
LEGFLKIQEGDIYYCDQDGYRELVEILEVNGSLVLCQTLEPFYEEFGQFQMKLSKFNALYKKYVDFNKEMDNL